VSCLLFRQATAGLEKGHTVQVTIPALVACAHGTRDVRGRRLVGALVAAVAAARPHLVVESAFVDVQPPTVADVVERACAGGGGAVVVPLLLSSGYHVGVDVAAAVEGRRAVAAGALGPDPRLTAVLLDRLAETGVAARDVVVVAAAGSSDPRAAADVRQVARAVQAHHAGPVLVGFGASAAPSVTDAVSTARREHPGCRVVVAAYLLAPGHFHQRLLACGADAVSAPLLREDAPPDPRLVDLVLDRYDSAAVSLTT
jgi:sirohydrochlorin ferrochelatase